MVRRVMAGQYGASLGRNYERNNTKLICDINYDNCSRPSQLLPKFFPHLDAISGHFGRNYAMDRCKK